MDQHVRSWVFGLGLLAAAAGAARADDLVDDEPERAGKRDHDKDKDKGDKGKKDTPAVEVGGRVFARFEAIDTDLVPWQSELSVASARLGVGYRWKDRLRAKVSVEAAGGDASVRDAFVEVAAGGDLDVRAGRFKVPVSAIEQASGWTLPTIGRPFVSDVLSDGLSLAGRQDGVRASWSGVAPVRVIASLTQSVATTGDDPPRPLDGDSLGGLHAAVRVEIEPCPGLVYGVTGSNREVNYVADVQRYWAASADAELDLEDRGLPLRLWADVVVGEGHFAAATADEPSSPFVAAQAIGAWRWGGADKNKPYLEPFVAGAYLNPTTAYKRDDLTQVQVGVNGGRWKRWRVQGQVSVIAARQDRPSGLGGTLVDIDDETRLSIQLGASF